ncbi:pentapeptide repeat-containing protein [Alkalimarinus alittae]|uniref:Pentapeptide repeat-containing protein n=1 Tax=Alkalimarinus alittae TaxID=2961619 RepID=A0ABY6N1I3_9ALTE|nr:pentapeptide repeat-containing protein [Alkalimarinus alittae]UZE95867.1 pentapeptide repeat-containing protein [Alkalimarinus alittae]
MTDQVRIIDDPLYQTLRSENISAFNSAKANTSPLPSFEFCDFRGLDLRGMNADGLDLRSAYFRGADLRGIDFRNAQIEGASIAGTKISGCYFPKNISSDELIMSLNHGTRLRCDV